MRVSPPWSWIPLAVLIAVLFLPSFLLLLFAGLGSAIAQESGKEGAAREEKGAEKGFKKEILAVLDFKTTGARESVSVTASIRLREELLRFGYFILVDRQRLKQVMDEQAREQVDCLTIDCNAAAGKITGARLILTGELIQLSETAWQASTVMTDVETGETLRAESIFFEGAAAALIAKGIPQLTDKLIPKGDPQKFGGVIPLLLRKPASPARGEDTAKGGKEQGEESGEEEYRLRFWGSPFSGFGYHISSKNFADLEDIIGFGYGLGLEWESERSIVFGGSLHWGNLVIREDHTGPSTSEIDISGTYRAWAAYALMGLPVRRPWFHFGSGLFGYSMEYTDAGTEHSASAYGILLMFRFMYTFEQGVVVGYAAQSNFVTLSSRGTRLEELKQAGEDPNPNTPGAATSFFLGYTF